ncbi:MAG: flagellar protein FlaR [Blastocatellia bacterium]|nr:flagellar protein FlaR [Blastocatellia bacterium]
MGRVAVIGNAGGGKSTLCRKLSLAKGIPLYSIDHIQWKPGWVQASPTEIKRKQDEILSSQRKWIIDGWGGWDDIKTRFAAADTIIFVDFPLWVHYWWAFKRQFSSMFVKNTDFPEGCPLWPKTWELFKLMWTIDRDIRPHLSQLIHSFSEGRLVIYLRSPGELRRFVREHCAIP